MDFKFQEKPLQHTRFQYEQSRARTIKKRVLSEDSERHDKVRRTQSMVCC